MKEIPPTGIPVAFQKSLESELPDGTISGICSGMVTIPLHEFWVGIRTAESIKDGSQRLPKGWQPEAVRRLAGTHEGPPCAAVGKG